MTLRRCSLILLLTACSSGGIIKSGPGAGDTGGPISEADADADSDVDADSDSDADSDDTGTADDPLPAGPCADGDWGNISDPEKSIHISLEPVALESDWGTDRGSPGNPINNMAEFAARDDDYLDGDYAIAFWPGTHTVEPGTISVAVQNGFRIEACSQSEVLLDLVSPPNHEGPLITFGLTGDGLGEPSAQLTGMTLSTDEAYPIVGITSADAVTLKEVEFTGANLDSLIEIKNSTNITISNATLTGGVHALSVHNSEVTVSSVTIENSTIAGIWTTGGTTNITMNNVVVQDTIPGAGMIAAVGGFGMFFEGGMVNASNIAIDGATGAGILADVQEFTLSTASISNVSEDGDGQYGRGIQILDSACSDTSFASLEYVTVEGTADAAVFVQLFAETHITGLKVENVGTSTIPEILGGGLAGDGLVITGRDTSTAGIFSNDPAMLVRVYESINILSPDRAAIIVDNAKLIVDGGTLEEGMLTDDTEGYVFTQNGGRLSSDMAFTDLGDGTSIAGGSSVGPQCLNLGKPSLSGAPVPALTDILACIAF